MQFVRRMYRMHLLYCIHHIQHMHHTHRKQHMYQIIVLNYSLCSGTKGVTRLSEKAVMAGTPRTSDLSSGSLTT